MSRKLRPLGALAMAALISAGCSNAPSETDSGSRDASGTFAYGIKRGASLDPSSAAWKKAIGACKDLPTGRFGRRKAERRGEGGGPEVRQCMRDNCLMDFPDPIEKWALINVEGARSISGVPGRGAEVPPCLLRRAGGELYFSIVQRKALTPNDFPNLQALTDRLITSQPTSRAGHRRLRAEPRRDWARR